MKHFASRLLVALAVIGLANLSPMLSGQLAAQPVLAASPTQCPDGSQAPDGDKANCPVAQQAPAPEVKTDCVKLSIPVFSSQKEVCGNGTQSIIVVYLISILKLLAKLIGGVIILMIIIAGIQYITAAGDPGAVKSAKGRITNAITALVLYLIMYAVLNFLIPGGIFN